MKKILFILTILITLSFLTFCEREDIFELSTAPQKIYIFTDNATNDGQRGGRAGLDSICNAKYNMNYSNDFKVATIHSLISVSASDQVKDIVPSEYGDVPVYAVNISTKAETLISNSWDEIWSNQSIMTPLNSAMGISTAYWTGSAADGSFDITNHCSNWTVAAGNGQRGDHASTTGTWFSNATIACGTPSTILCVGW